MTDSEHFGAGTGSVADESSGEGATGVAIGSDAVVHLSVEIDSGHVRDVLLCARRARVTLGFLWVSALWFAMELVRGPGPAWPDVVFTLRAGLLVFVVACTVLWLGVLPWQAVRNTRSTTWTVSPEGIRVEAPHAVSTYEWAFVRRVTAYRRVIIVRTTAKVSLLLPRASVSDAQLRTICGWMGSAGVELHGLRPGTGR